MTKSRVIRSLLPPLVVTAILVAAFIAPGRQGLNTVFSCYGYGYGCGAPTITSVSNNEGPLAGGTTVTITGTNFDNNAGAQPLVFFGSTPALSRTFVSDTKIVAVSPA